MKWENKGNISNVEVAKRSHNPLKLVNKKIYFVIIIIIM